MHVKVGCCDYWWQTEGLRFLCFSLRFLERQLLNTLVPRYIWPTLKGSRDWSPLDGNSAQSAQRRVFQEVLC